MPDPPQIHPAFERISAALVLLTPFTERPNDHDWHNEPPWTAVLYGACCLLRAARRLLAREP